MKVTIYWVTNDWRIIRRIREKYRLPQYMTLNGITEAELAIGISAEWRELMDAADRPSPHIGGWSEREEEAVIGVPGQRIHQPGSPRNRTIAACWRGVSARCPLR